MAYRGHKLITHGGTVSGFSGQVHRFVDDDITIIVLTNSKSGADRIGYAEVLANGIADLYFKPTRLTNSANRGSDLSGSKRGAIFKYGSEWSVLLCLFEPFEGFVQSRRKGPNSNKFPATPKSNSSSSALVEN
ncbi:MAG TPA: hypothetical protein VFM05_10220 [Candidatus Saccharimonadales bacterium]|nr:hypothetical protein [Candidatus Saccharimonadales bacterium]